METENKILKAFSPLFTIFTNAPGCIMAGHAKTEQMLKVDNTTHIVLGTYTPEEVPYNKGDEGKTSFFRIPKEGVTLYQLDNGNPGLKASLTYIANTQIAATKANKKLVVSITAPMHHDFQKTVSMLLAMCQSLLRVDVVNIDLSLPGMAHGYSPLFLKQLLKVLKPLQKELWITLPNYKVWGSDEFDERYHLLQSMAVNLGYDLTLRESSFTNSSLDLLASVCGVIEDSGAVSAVFGPGPLPNVEMRKLHTGEVAISYNNRQATGNLTGAITAPFSRSQVHTLTELLNSNILVGGFGGMVENSVHLLEILTYGAGGGFIHGRFLEADEKEKGVTFEYLLAELDMLTAGNEIPISLSAIKKQLSV